MLFQLLDEVLNRISTLDPNQETARFFEQVRRSKPELFDEMIRKGAKEEVVQVIGHGIALMGLQYIKQIPEIASSMVRQIRGESTDPALGCMMTATLAYLVQPHDLIPDDAPGGFGFVDDYILLRAGQLEFLSNVRGRDAEVAEITQNISTMGSLVPGAVKPQMQDAIEGLSTLVQLISVMPPDMQVMTTQTIIANPLQGATPQIPPGFSPHPGFQVRALSPQLNWEGQHTWQDGDKMGVSFPGGGGVVTDGRDVFPI